MQTNVSLSQSMLFIEVPPYRDPTICHPAKVNFYVINGKRKRSQPQHFTYTPLPGTLLKSGIFILYHCTRSEDLLDLHAKFTHYTVISVDDRYLLS